jgi:WhiB family transcriptional regulator, redox-sensing transcriptional regulator
VDWRERARCARPDIDPEWFFPTDGGSPRKAQRICESCPVRKPCLAYAHATRSDGVWAGTTERERRAVRRRRAVA